MADNGERAGAVGAAGAAGADRPVNPNATRDHLANQRTLLAWVRTGIAITGLGFVVARFGLVIRELGAALPRRTPRGLSTDFGVALIACGAALVVLATLQYRYIGRAIEWNSYRPSNVLPFLLSSGFVAVAALLAVYLFATA